MRIVRRDVDLLTKLNPREMLVGTRVELYLEQKLKDGFNEVLIEVEVIVRHLSG